MKAIEKFLKGIEEYIEYWGKVDVSEKEKMYGLAFSMLNILDGTSHNTELDIMDIACEWYSNSVMLHEEFSRDKEKEEKKRYCSLCSGPGEASYEIYKAGIKCASCGKAIGGVILDENGFPRLIRLDG